MMEMSRFGWVCAGGRIVALMAAVEIGRGLFGKSFTISSCETRLWSGNVSWASPKQMDGGW